MTDKYLGLPPSFGGPRKPLYIEPSKGPTITDENFYRKPSCPIAPLFAAIYHSYPNYDPNDLDLVTDDNNLHDLFNAIIGRNCQNFRIDIQIIGKTMIFTRWHKDLEEYPTCPQYEKKLIKAITSGNKTHYRIVRFQWGGLNVVERCSIDAYNREAPKCFVFNRATPQVNLSGSSSDAPATTLRVNNQGVLVSQESLFQFTCCPDTQKVDMDLLFPRLFFSQVPNVLIGFHRNGIFDWFDVRRDLNSVHSPDTLMSWKTRMAPELRAVVLVIKAIRRVLQKSQQNAGMVVVEEGQIKIYGGNQKRAKNTELLGKLPDELVIRWNNMGAWKTR